MGCKLLLQQSFFRKGAFTLLSNLLWRPTALHTGTFQLLLANTPDSTNQWHHQYNAKLRYMPLEIPKSQNQSNYTPNFPVILCLEDVAVLHYTTCANLVQILQILTSCANYKMSSLGDDQRLKKNTQRAAVISPTWPKQGGAAGHASNVCVILYGKTSCRATQTRRSSQIQHL